MKDSISRVKPTLRYEQLREKVLQHQPVDLECFLERGLAEWITFSSLSSPLLSVTRPLFNSTNSKGHHKTKIISILTEIMLHHQKGDKDDNIPSLF